MIVIPKFETIHLSNYGLFPGISGDHQVDIDFRNGLTVLAGINGLGKTTLLNLLLRMISGPYDLTSTGAPEKYEAILPSNATKLKPNVIDFFSQRVADGAENAISTLTMKFGDKEAVISRNMSTLSLAASLTIDGVETASSESEYQSTMADLFNVSTFVHVLLLLHNIVFFNEKKAGALWDANAQRHVLGAIVLGKVVALKFDEVTRRVQTADSQFRNTRAQANKFQKQLNELAVKEEQSPEVRAHLAATIEAIEGSSEKLDHLENSLSELSERHKEKRLELEKAKLENESALGLIERAKYTSLLHAFPKMEDAARLLLARILSEAECLVCGAEAEGKKAELEKLLLEGFCPACGADPEDQASAPDSSKFEKVKMSAARKKADVATSQLRKAAKSFEKVDIEKSNALEQVVSARTELAVLKSSQEQLNALLPSDSEKVQSLRKIVEGFNGTLAEERATLELAASDYSQILGGVTKQIVKAAKKLSVAFGQQVNKLLSESAQLLTTEGRAKIGQESASAFEFPVFVAEMTAANKPGLTARQSQDDVSESQRELIDLAFRLALIEVACADGNATFVMETPEASLDGIAMKKVGSTLKDFSETPGTRLIITNNLTNAGMVTAIFGGVSSSKKEQRRREQSVFNLLQEAAPNQALSENRDEYEGLLQEAIYGVRVG